MPDRMRGSEHAANSILPGAQAERAREALDQRLVPLGSASRYTSPPPFTGEQGDGRRDPTLIPSPRGTGDGLHLGVRVHPEQQSAADGGAAGRHSRLAADLLADVLGKPTFTWGSENLSSPGEARRAYMEALRTADDRDDYRPLLEFARS
jgi:hypothetical protein